MQATWTVEGEERSYAPVFTRTRRGAERQKAEIEETLWHFPTLDVKVEQVTAEARAQEEHDREAALLEEAKSTTPHMKLEYDDPVTACGLAEEDVKAWSLPEIYELTFEDGRCPGCAEALARMDRDT